MNEYSETNGEQPESNEQLPKTSGESENKTDENKPLSDREVMEHTANIWKYTEIIDDGTEMHGEFHEKFSKTAFGNIIGARVRGKAHKHNGTNCDDYFETAFTKDFAAAVVCDGAGSQRLSRIGSRVSAENAAGYLKTKLSELFSKDASIKDRLCADISSEEFMSACGSIALLVQNSAKEALKAQNDELLRLENDESYLNVLGRKPVISDMSTTFLAAVVVPLDGGKGRFTACVQIGDGCICALDTKESGERSVKLLGEADSGKFSSETVFLSQNTVSDAAIASKTRVSRGNSDIIMLMTDGVADDYFPAATMMQRLYIDLCLNGILPMSVGGETPKSPAPISYPAVSAERQSVALQYAKQLAEDSSPESMKALWEKRDMLGAYSLEAYGVSLGEKPEERLRVWLDNYNERTSFDDRTLVIIDFKDFN